MTRATIGTTTPCTCTKTKRTFRPGVDDERLTACKWLRTIESKARRAKSEGTRWAYQTIAARLADAHEQDVLWATPGLPEILTEIAADRELLALVQC